MPSMPKTPALPQAVSAAIAAPQNMIPAMKPSLSQIESMYVNPYDTYNMYPGAETMLASAYSQPMA